MEEEEKRGVGKGRLDAAMSSDVAEVTSGGVDKCGAQEEVGADEGVGG